MAATSPAFDDLGPVPTPEIPAPATGSNRWLALLQANEIDVSRWAAGQLEWVAAMMRTESGKIGAGAVSSKGARGLLQVMPGTADQVYGMGYTKYPPTPETLGTDAGGIYYGTAYLEYLSKQAPTTTNLDWITKAYFGGPGWPLMGPNYQQQCADYLALVKVNFEKNKRE